MLQVALIYWATAARKSGPLWWSGQAIFFALHREAWVTPFGEWLRGYPGLLVPLTYATLALEWLGPCLAFVPSAAGVFRLAAVALFWGFHISLATMMSIGLFPLVSMVAWLPFCRRLPGPGSARQAATRRRRPPAPWIDSPRRLQVC